MGGRWPNSEPLKVHYAYTMAKNKPSFGQTQSRSKTRGDNHGKQGKTVSSLTGDDPNRLS